MVWAHLSRHVYTVCVDGCNFKGVIYHTEAKSDDYSTPPILHFPERDVPQSAALPPLPVIADAPEIVLTELLDIIETQENEADENMPDITLTTPATPVSPTHHTAEENTEADAPYTPPSYDNCPRPPYPPRMRQRRAVGTVQVLIHVSAQGEPTEVIITQSSGYAALDSHTRNWILAHWKFNPALKGNRPQAAQIRTSINYTLHT